MGGVFVAVAFVVVVAVFVICHLFLPYAVQICVLSTKQLTTFLFQLVSLLCKCSRVIIATLAILNMHMYVGKVSKLLRASSNNNNKQHSTESECWQMHTAPNSATKRCELC